MGALKLKFENLGMRGHATPIILHEPQNQRIRIGARLSLCVIVKENCNFQWFKNGQKIPGATHFRFLIPQTSKSDAGNYSCEIYNEFGSTVSRTATVSFVEKQFHRIVLQPAHVIIQNGKPFVWRVESEDLDPSKLEFQWLHNGKRIKGANSSQLKIFEVKKRHEGEYKAIVVMGSEIVATNTAQLSIFFPEKTPFIKEEIIPAQYETHEDYFFNPDEPDSSQNPVQDFFPAPSSDLLGSGEITEEAPVENLLADEPIAEDLSLVDPLDMETPLELPILEEPKFEEDLLSATKPDLKEKKRAALEKMLNLFAKK